MLLRRHLDVTPELVTAFVEATGDASALHVDPEVARLTRFRGTIVHGMLPVACLLIALEPVLARQRVRLSAITCQFEAPVVVGDRLELVVSGSETGGHGLVLGMAIARVAGQALVTSGDLTLVARDGTGDGTGGDVTGSDGTGHAVGGLLARPVDELELTLADLPVGTTQALDLIARPAALGPLRELLYRSQPHHWSRDNTGLPGPNSLVLLAASTLVGMRLPGRHATLLSCRAAFPSEIAANAPVQLTGTIDALFAASGRARIAMTWMADGTVVGTGSVTTIVDTPAPPVIGCDVISRLHMATGLAGRVALVTGASRGIGAATAKLLAMHGAKVAVHYFAGAKDAAAVVADIAAHGGVAVAVGADLRDEEQIENLHAVVRKQLGDIDVLVNNAIGDFTPKPMMELSAPDYLREFDISVFGMHACCKRVVPHMRRQKWGKIVNVGSIATDMPVAGQNKYVTAKAAVEGYTRSLAVEVAADNIQVNMVVPAMTDTSLLASLPGALVSRLASETPSGRLLQPIDVAQAIVLLASDWLAGMSGQRLVLNQGAPPFA